MRIKRIYILICLFVVFGIVILLMVNAKKDKKEIEQQEELLEITSFNIQERTSYIKNNEIYIGNSLKEIENGFYDIKIVNNNGIDIYLSKLWYETYGTDYIQDEYLARICREMVAHLGINTSKEDGEYEIYKYIKENYMKVREEERVLRYQNRKFESFL